MLPKLSLILRFVVVNRIKSHTKFKAPVESGLMKMMAIGMGKQKGAEFYHKAAVPMYFESDHGAIEVGLGAIGLIPAEKIKIVRIKNTHRLKTVEVSETYAEAFQQRPDLGIIGGPYRMEFNSQNNQS